MGDLGHVIWQVFRLHSPSDRSAGNILLRRRTVQNISGASCSQNSIFRRSESQPALQGGQHPKTIDMYSESLSIKTSMLSIEIILLNVPSGGSLERNRPTDICLSMCVRVRVSVCPSILVSVARRDGPIRKGEEDRPDERSS